jgi:Na+:H+ antiporter, NhaA family
MRQSIKSFINHEAAGGILLILAACIALLIANSPLAELYTEILNLPVTVGITLGDFLVGLKKSVLLWINDVLMALFFLLVGLEIKREFLMGELSTRQKALQPFFAALGGMVVPAAVYLIVTRHNPQFLPGWAIASATDIAFALGILALLGSAVPQSVKILLTAIAILDDLGAILIIAFFYTGDIQWYYLMISAMGIGGLCVLNLSNVNRIAPYILFGIAIWLGFLKSGLHPTLAGVITAIAIPLRTTTSRNMIYTPLMRLEHALHAWIVFGVLPIFALANAGLSFSGLHIASVLDTLPFGIILGLFIGKPLGIMAGLLIGHYIGLARKPDELRWRDYAGMSILCGIGFTMALFIGELAFDSADYRNEVRLGVLSASLLSAGIGWCVCRLTFFRKKP